MRPAACCLPAQPASCRQRGGHIEQLIGGSHPALGAKLHGAAQLRHTLKAEAALQHAIEGEQFGGLRQQLATGLKAGSQRQLAADAAASRGAGEAGHVLPKPAPLEQLEGFVLDNAEGGCCLGLMSRFSNVPNGIPLEIRTRSAGRSNTRRRARRTSRREISRQRRRRRPSLRPDLRCSRHAGKTAIGSAPVLEGMPPAGS